MWRGVGVVWRGHAVRWGEESLVWGKCGVGWDVLMVCVGCGGVGEQVRGWRKGMGSGCGVEWYVVVGWVRR